MPRILIVLSGVDHWTQADGSKKPSGYWAEEFVVPHEKFVAAGVDVDIATPGGAAPTPDPVSLSAAVAGEAEAAHFADYIAAHADELGAPLALADVDAADYDAIVIPGGHGPMEDLAVDPAMGRLLTGAVATERVIAPLCHGPAALLSATDPEGNWLFAGRRLTSFTNEEESQNGTAAGAPWLLQSRLAERGAVFSGGQPWTAVVVADGALISGQNPASSAELADRVIAAISR